MPYDETDKHPLKGLSMLITVVVLPLAIWHGFGSLFILMMADYTKNPLWLLLLVSAAAPLIVLVRRVREREWSGRDGLLIGLTALPGLAVTIGLARESHLLEDWWVVILLVSYVVASAGSIPLVRARAFH